MLGHLRPDISYAVRLLRRQPMLSAVSILTLGLGVSIDAARSQMAAIGPAWRGTSRARPAQHRIIDELCARRRRWRGIRT